MRTFNSRVATKDEEFPVSKEDFKPIPTTRDTVGPSLADELGGDLEEDLPSSFLTNAERFWELPAGAWRSISESPLPEPYASQRRWEGRKPTQYPTHNEYVEAQRKSTVDGRTEYDLERESVPDGDGYYFLPLEEKLKISGAHPLLVACDHHPLQLCTRPGCMVKILGSQPGIPGLRDERIYSQQNGYPNIGVLHSVSYSGDRELHIVSDEAMDQHRRHCRRQEYSPETGTYQWTANKPYSLECMRQGCPLGIHMRYCDSHERHHEGCPLKNQITKIIVPQPISAQILPLKYTPEGYIPHISMGIRTYPIGDVSHLEHLDPRDFSWQPGAINPFNREFVENLRTYTPWAELLQKLESAQSQGVDLRLVRRDVKFRTEGPGYTIRKPKNENLKSDEIVTTELGDGLSEDL